MPTPFSNVSHNNVLINLPFLALSDFNKHRYSSITKFESQFSFGFFGKGTPCRASDLRLKSDLLLEI